MVTTDSMRALEKLTSVSMVVGNNSGDIATLDGGVNAFFPPLLKHWASLDDDFYTKHGVKERWVTKVNTTLGQDVYRVSRDFVLWSRTGLTSLSISDIVSLEKRIGETQIIHFVVSY